MQEGDPAWGLGEASPPILPGHLSGSVGIWDTGRTFSPESYSGCRYRPFAAKLSSVRNSTLGEPLL